MADSNHPASTTLTKRVASPKSNSLLGKLVGYLVVLFVFFFLVLIFGHVSGTEVNTDTFQRRQYTFFQIPLLRLQCTPVWTSNADNRLADYVGSKGMLTPNPATERWDVIQVRVGGRSMVGDAEILDDYLDMVDPTHTGIWEQWTANHPVRAKALWQAVQQAVQLESYELIPHLFAAAETTEDELKLQQVLDEIASEQYAEMASDYAELGESDRAARLYKAALQHKESPQHRQAYQQLQSEL